MNYRGANIRVLKAPTLDEVRALYTRLLGHGCNAVALNTIHYWPVGVVDNAAAVVDVPAGWYPRSSLVFPDIGQDGRGISETTDIARVYAFAELAWDMGFEKVVLKPMIDQKWPDGSAGGWRGWVRVPQSMRRRFADDYARFLRPYAQVAQELECDLCMGTELLLVSRELGAEFWIDQAVRLRGWGGRAENFTRQLTYAANWGWPTDAAAEYNVLRALWDSDYLDYISINAYYPFGSAEAARDGYTPVIDDLEALKQSTGLPVYFMEYGWPNRAYAAQEPWGRDDPAGEFTTGVSGPMHALFRARFSDVLEGAFVWEAGLAVPEGEVRTHDILGSGLEDVVWGESHT